MPLTRHSLQLRHLESIAPRYELFLRHAGPSEVLQLLRKGHVVDERRELSVEERQVHLSGERRCKTLGTADLDRPGSCFPRDVLETAECAQEYGGRLPSEPGNTWDTVGCVADEREPVGHACRTDASRA